jgi:Tfp pilus assembly protein PilV
MSVTANAQRGATLLEVMIAVVMVTVTIAIMSLAIPKAAKSITNSRQRLVANNLAASRMQELKATPYPLIDLTAATVANFLVSNIGDPGCDCRPEDVSSMPTAETTIYMEDSVTYTRKVCVNLVSGAAGVWTPHCPNPAPAPLDNTRDFGLKNIRIQVSWVSGAQTFTTEMEGLVTR